MARSYSDSSRSAQRKLVGRALVRPTLSGAVLFVLYFALPLNNRFRAGTVVILIAGLCVLAGLVALQVRTIVRSPHPRLTAITALAFSIPLFVLLFATTYFLMEQTASTAFTQSMTRLDSLYFTVTVLTTVGFGDISPHSELARTLTTLQMVGDLLLIGLVVRVLLGAVQTGLAGRAGRGTIEPDEPSEPDA
jgi:voltage-gated potassium channel